MKALIIETGEVISVVDVIKTISNGTIYRDVASGKTYFDHEIQIFDDSGVMEFVEMWLPNYSQLLVSGKTFDEFLAISLPDSRCRKRI